MKQLSNPGRFPLWMAHTHRPYGFSSPCDGEEFALLLVLGEEEITADEQEVLSMNFVRQGCRYAVCTGVGCSSWDDSIDMVGVMDEIEGRREAFVMTTWHEKQPLEEVAEFFALNTSFDEWTAERFVVQIVGGSRGLEAKVLAAVQKAFRLKSELM